MIRYIIYLLFPLVISCLGGRSVTVPVEVPAKVPQFSYPDIPTMITDDGERMRYFTEHYWDNYDFADSLLINNDSISGGAMAGYISLLELNDTTTVRSSIQRAMDRGVEANYDNFLKFCLIFENYLYDPNSPMRNEELYISVLEYIVSSDRVEVFDKVRPEKQLKMALKNRVGEMSTDFTYSLKSGEKRRVHDINANYTILFFNSPDCEECARVKSYMVASKSIVEYQKSGKLKILALYPDSNVELWRNSEYHPMFINAYDDGQIITKYELYDLRAIPTLYLINNQNYVVLKDTTIEEIELNLRKLLLKFRK